MTRSWGVIVVHLKIMSIWTSLHALIPINLNLRSMTINLLWTQFRILMKKTSFSQLAVRLTLLLPKDSQNARFFLCPSKSRRTSKRTQSQEQNGNEQSPLTETTLWTESLTLAVGLISLTDCLKTLLNSNLQCLRSRNRIRGLNIISKFQFQDFITFQLWHLR